MCIWLIWIRYRKPTNAAVIADIGRAINIPFQLGGGIRSREALERALELGAMRVILGTVAVKEPDLARELAVEYGERILISIDARHGKVAVKGWTEGSDLGALELARQVEGWGVQEVVYTDIQRDGTLRGLNLQGIEDILHILPSLLVAGDVPPGGFGRSQAPGKGEGRDHRAGPIPTA